MALRCKDSKNKFVGLVYIQNAISRKQINLELFD